ncbi:MAG: TolC family protein [Rickettsiales bacterium]|nr:TolC family protein [Rickettsiales bacterium]
MPQSQTVKKDKIAIPKNFPKYNQEEINSDKEVKKEEDVIDKNWKLFFKDERLISLIESALKNNQELNILNQEINIANNEVMARQGAYIPKVGIGAGYGYDKVSEYTSQGVSDNALGVPEKLRNRQFGLDASWEIDIWKKLRNAAKSSYYQYLSSIEGKNYAVTRLVSEIASNYYELMALDNELEIVKKYVATLEQSQKIVQLQQIAGRTTSLAVRRFDAEVLKNKSREYKIKQDITIVENRLNILLGRLPQKIKRDSDKFIAIEMPQVVTGIPVKLLENRPDVKQASLKLEAAKLNVKSVKAQFYPSLNIDAAIGYQAFNSKHLIDSPTSLFYNVAGGVTAPLLNRRAIKADYFSANNQQMEAIYNYDQTFIKAFAEVSNQLASITNLEQIYSLKTKQTEALSASFEISNILFKAARVDYLESLLTRRDYLESQVELIEVKQKQIESYINLYKALGGGWRNAN